MKSKKKKGFSSNKFNRKPQRPIEVKEILIEKIDLNSKRVSITGKINRIVQTGGPTVFIVSDGTGSFALKGFIGPGERAYPEINEEDVVKATINVGEYQGEIEGEIVKIHKVSENENKIFLDRIKKIEYDRAKVEPPEFMVKSPILDKLKERFVDAATL